MFAFGNCYSSRIQKSFQILNAHGHNVIPFDSLTSNSIHFRIANISTSVKISPFARTFRKCLSKSQLQPISELYFSEANFCSKRWIDSP